MKITKARLRDIIKEEIDGLFNETEVEAAPEEEVPAPEGDEEKLKMDVERVLNYIPSIDNAIEYQQILKSLLQHDWGDERAKALGLKKVVGTAVATKILDILAQSSGA